MNRSARPERVPTMPLTSAHTRAATLARKAWARTQVLVVRGLKALRHTWRSSLQFRVVTTTMLLGLMVIMLLGSYLYQSISNGLEQDRIDTATLEASRLATEAQQAFDATDSTESAAQLGLFARDLVQQKMASPGADNSRQVVFTRSLANSSKTFVATVCSDEVCLPSIPQDLRAAVSDNPRRQQYKLISIQLDPRSEEAVPAVMVGSQIELPVAGAYDLYFAFPMEREEQTLELITNTFAFGGIALVLLVGAVAFVVTRQVVLPVRRAAVVAERLSSGKLNERMRSRGEDDLAMLGKSFNEMADSLQTQIRQLEGLSRVQQRFVSDVSHELRTPLTTIRMAADLLHDSRTSFEPVVSRSAELLHTRQSCCTTSSTALRSFSPTCWRSAGSTQAPRPSTLRRRTFETRWAERSRPPRRSPTGVAARSLWRPRATAWPRSTADGSSGSCETLSSMPSSMVRDGRLRYRLLATTLPWPSQSGTTGWASGRARPLWSSTGSGARTPLAPAQRGELDSVSRSPSRTPGCTTDGCRHGGSRASVRASDSPFLAGRVSPSMSRHYPSSPKVST